MFVCQFDQFTPTQENLIDFAIDKSFNDNTISAFNVLNILILAT